MIVGHTPVKYQGLGFEFFQTRSDIGRPMTAPAALPRADVNQESLKLRV